MEAKRTLEKYIIKKNNLRNGDVYVISTTRFSNPQNGRPRAVGREEEEEEEE
jgi:hypothetical protein